MGTVARNVVRTTREISADPALLIADVI